MLGEKKQDLFACRLIKKMGEKDGWTAYTKIR